MPDAPRLRAVVDNVTGVHERDSIRLSRLSMTSFAFWVSTRLVNPTNERGHWSARARRSTAQRDAVAQSVWTTLRASQAGIVWRLATPATTPKTVTFTAHVARKFDSDGLQAAMKSIRDGLQDCGLIHSDGPDSGHVFEYAQLVDRARRGVEITVRLREAARDA
jgi:hypothetical protein